MATSAKHLSRKELREPDRFMVVTQQVLDFVRDNRVLTISAAVVLAILMTGIFAWQIYKNHQNDDAAQSYDTAMTLYRSAKYKEAIDEFQKVEGYRWSRYAALAHLYEANSRIAVNDFEKAENAARRFIAATDETSVYRQIGLVTLAHAEELKAQCKQAVEHYNDAQRINAAFKETATFGKARCFVKLGDNKSAIATYQQYIKENPNAPISTRLHLEIAELQKGNAKPAK
jgi:predicted negative regulator of RcsB-dependent stress response